MDLSVPVYLGGKIGKNLAFQHSLFLCVAYPHMSILAEPICTALTSQAAEQVFSVLKTHTTAVRYLQGLLF